ncbi:hypothetical protein ACJJIP_08435 [Microbulbifer sp. VTAC004]|uniref:hypothetical protein n=1 Tax=Microbulbifer sp. VTAC004 TaxID=3243386 RepID=UPI0040398D3F
MSDEIQFPMFDFTDVKGTVGFDFWLNPVLPTNFFATRLQLDVTNRSDNQEWATEAKAIASSYFFTTEGAPVKLSPYDPGTVLPVNGEIGAGFGFSKMQDQDISGLPAHFPSNLYLSPVGIFTLENIEADGKNSIIELMPGLYSQEFLRISEGTKIQFINDQPAYARSFSVSGSPSDSPPSNLDLLQNDYTTSWMQVLTEEGHYFGKPSSGSFFVEQDGGPFSNSVDARLATLSNSTAFPCVPLGGIFSAPSPLNSEQISRFEATILSSARHGQLTLHSEGPVFLPGGSLLGPSSMLSSTTPQGLLIELNDDGSWNKVVLAKQPAMLNADPPIPETQLQFLSYGSPPKFPADLSLILTQNQLFFIVTEPSECWSFDSTIFLSGFQFELGFDSENPDAQLIMIFKFNTTASVAELVANPGLWTGAEHYNSDPEATSALIDDYITFAQQRVPGDPFEHFNNLVNDPAWTGVLFLNTGINGNGMPADLQMLLGGVNGPLRAHHLGIQGNMMDVEAKSGKLEIDQSSLFGVIFYNGNGQPSNPDLCDTPVDYETETLVVVFSNSSITQFNTSVGLTLNQLMGRDVQLIHPPVDSKLNTISIKGQYQAGSDGVGRMTFISEQKFKYKFIVNDPNIDPVVPNVRVLEKVEFNQASLVPVSSQPVQEKDTTEVSARFSLSGALWFCPNPFPDSDQLDLFSYGCKDGPDVGLAISNLSVDVDFTLNEVGITVPDSKRVTLDLTAMTADPSTDAIRPNSLLFSIPLKFSRFIVGEEEAINATNTGSTAVNILQLESNPINADSLVQPALLDSPDQAASPPSTYVTSAPRYALEYDMLLGSLGALGADAKLEAKVLLAWGPSSTIPDNDAAALFIQLPQLSAGAGGFELEGVLKTVFGDANLLKVDLENGSQTVYGILFNNVQLSAFGYSFPPGVMVDFTVFAGTTTPETPEHVIPTYANNLAWFLSVKPEND